MIIGPLNGTKTGQNIVTEQVLNSFSPNTYGISTGGTGLSKISIILLLIRSYCKFLLLIFQVKFRCILYVSLSRSYFGLLKESIFALTSRIFAIPVILHWHGAEVRNWRKQNKVLLPYFYRKLWSHVDFNLSLCQDMKNDLNYFGFCNISIVENFYDLNSGLQSDAFGDEDQKIQFLFLSNLLPGKGFEDCVLALSKQKTENLLFNVVGSNDFSNRKKNIRLIEENSHFIHYHGVLHGPKKSKVLNNSDVLLLPSLYRTEAIPLAVIEAICCGLKVVVYDHNYMNYFGEFKNVTIVEPNQKKLCEAIASIIQSSQDKIVDQAELEIYRKRFSPNRFNEEMYEVLKLAERKINHDER